MEHVFTTDASRTSYTLELTWQEWTTVRRLRVGMTKAQLAKACGVGRTTLWRAIEASRDDPKWLPLTDEMMQRVEAALSAAEAAAERAA